MYELIGALMFYVWIHSGVVIVRKLKNVTAYEYVVLSAGAVAFGTFVIGVLIG